MHRSTASSNPANIILKAVGISLKRLSLVNLKVEEDSTPSSVTTEWPGLSGTGNEFLRVAIPDQEVEWGWPLVFQPEPTKVFTYPPTMLPVHDDEAEVVIVEPRKQ